MLSRFKISQSSSFQTLCKQVRDFQKEGLKHQFELDPNRTSRFSLEFQSFYFDYSKHYVSDEILASLEKIANEAKMGEAIEEMFAGKAINETENRSVFHVALRNTSGSPMKMDGVDVMPLVTKEWKHMEDFVEKVHNGSFQGYTGKPIKQVINIGIGGSDLGPVMVTEGLVPFHCGPKIRYVSNVDGAHLQQTLDEVDIEETLFVIVSKTFTTQETMTNALEAKRVLVEKLGEDAVANHFVAVSTNTQAVVDFGIHQENIFTFWDWVGGRYSLWSSVGLSIALAVGWKNFYELLKGAHEMDKHFRTAPVKQNIPLLQALIGIIYNNVLDFQSYAILPYAQNLHRLPAYLQQADMESSGKSIGRDGKRVEHQTGPVIWGEAGTNGQHAFYQFLHQGTKIIPADIIAVRHPEHNLLDHHRKLLANAIAQAEALMNGKSGEEVASEFRLAAPPEEIINPLIAHKSFEGNRPTGFLLFDQLNPRNLGMLIAMYEDKIFAQGILWNVFSFDQWGVELGKQMAKTILNEIEGGKKENHDSSTAELVRRCKS